MRLKENSLVFPRELYKSPTTIYVEPMYTRTVRMMKRLNIMKYLILYFYLIQFYYLHLIQLHSKLFFLVVLILGLAYAWKKGALKWE